MTAGTGDGDKTMRMNTSDPSAHPGLRLNTSDDASHGFTPDMFEESKPQSQVTPLDIPACLALMIDTIDKAIDQTPYENEKDALIDAMEQLQVAQKVLAKIVQFEFQEGEPLAKGVLMDHNG